jgi:hypothetical protein
MRGQGMGKSIVGLLFCCSYLRRALPARRARWDLENLSQSRNSKSMIIFRIRPKAGAFRGLAHTSPPARNEVAPSSRFFARVGAIPSTNSPSLSY